MPSCRMANATQTGLQRRPCGIIRVTALCPLCRYRHNGHATGAKNRLDRDLTGRFGDQAYAMEELVAEITSAFVMAELQLRSEPHKDAITYLAHWLEVLRRDKRAIFTAAAQASRAAALITSEGGP